MCSLILNKYSQLLCYQAAVSPVSVHCWRLFSICLWEVELRGWVKHYHAGQLFTADKPNCLMMLALPSCASSRSHFSTFYGLNSINSGQILHNFNLSGCCKVSNSYWVFIMWLTWNHHNWNHCLGVIDSVIRRHPSSEEICRFRVV